MGHRLLWSTAAVTALVASPLVAAGQSVQLGPVADATIYLESENANGGGTDLLVGRNGQGNDRRALLRFDVAGSIPAGSTITAVTLQLEVTAVPNSAQSPPMDPLPMALHRVTASWTVTGGNPTQEGQGGAPQTGDVTRTYRTYDTVMWSTVGGDFSGTASSTAQVPYATGTVQWTGAGLVSDVQGWLDTPANNRGWIVVKVPPLANREARRFASSEDVANTSPVLAISYDPPPEPTGACCADDGQCGEILDAQSGSCDGSYQGEGTDCTPNPCPAPEGACCLPNAAATCEAQTQATCGELGGIYNGDLVSCDAVTCPVVLEPFVDPLPIPKTATPTSGGAGAEAQYRMEMVQLRRKLHRDLPRTTVWGYDDGTGGSFPGPTIEARSNQPVSVVWANNLRTPNGDLRSSHYLSVDSCVHGADDDVPRTVVHLHGGHVAAAYDGYPEDAYPPGEEVTYEYPNWQHASTLWYHDHALGITRLNVYMGLAGLYIIRDEVEEALGLPSGEYDVPLVLMDRSFHPDGSLSYPESWQGMFTGESILVNGKVWPYFEVDRGKYRLRILNGSGTRTYDLSLSDGRSMALIGTDGGLLPEPEVLSSIVVAPGERVEVVIDFGVYESGTEIVLENSAPANYPNGSDGIVPNVMQFRVGAASGDQRPLKVNLRDLPDVPEADNIAARRDFVLAPAPDPCTGNKWLINGLGWQEIRERPRLGTTEIWRFINDSGMMHPMHMHLVFFQVIDRQQFVMVDGEPTPIGDPIEPAPNEQGWHDTIQVMPGEMLRVIAHFKDFTGRFPYHCHNLEHEDHDMMRQFETVTLCGDGARGLPEEECDDGNETEACDEDCTFVECGDGHVNSRAGEECDDGNGDDGDGCSAECTPEEDDGGDGDGGGCFCQSSTPTAGHLMLALLALLPFARRRRTR